MKKKIQNTVTLEWFCDVQSESECSVGDEYISGTEHNCKLKFGMQTHLTHINTIFKYCHASVNLNNVDVLHLEDGNVCNPVLKNKTSTLFSPKNPFLLRFVKLVDKDLELYYHSKNVINLLTKVIIEG